MAQVVPYELFAGALRLDGPTLGNLEILATPEGSTEGSLLARLDSCVYPGKPALHPAQAAHCSVWPVLQLLAALRLLTGAVHVVHRPAADLCCRPAGGHRLLRKWLCRPLRSIPDIDARLDAVQGILDHPGAGGAFRKALGKQVIPCCLCCTYLQLTTHIPELQPTAAAAKLSPNN